MRGGGGAWMAKLDLQNAFWSVVLPRGWRRVFVLKTADGRSYRYTRLPFGWRHFPLICQSLVRGIVAAALRGVRARAWVYIDDILVTARSPSQVRRAHNPAPAAGGFHNQPEKRNDTHEGAQLHWQAHKHGSRVLPERPWRAAQCAPSMGEGHGPWNHRTPQAQKAAWAAVLAFKAQCRPFLFHGRELSGAGLGRALVHTEYGARPRHGASVQRCSPDLSARQPRGRDATGAGHGRPPAVCRRGTRRGTVQGRAGGRQAIPPLRPLPGMGYVTPAGRAFRHILCV